MFANKTENVMYWLMKKLICLCWWSHIICNGDILSTLKLNINSLRRFSVEKLWITQMNLPPINSVCNVLRIAMEHRYHYTDGRCWLPFQWWRCKGLLTFWPSMYTRVYLSSYPGYFREPHWFSMGLPEISRVTLAVICKSSSSKERRTWQRDYRCFPGVTFGHSHWPPLVPPTFPSSWGTRLLVPIVP